MTYSEMMIAEIQNGNLELAEENLELALSFDDEETLYLLGNTLLQLGFLIETKRVYNHLIDVNPNDDELKVYLAEIEIEDGNEIEALELLHAIEHSSPSYPQALLVQADYYHLNGLPEVSIQKLLEAESLLPEEEVIHFALGEVYFTMADYQNAIRYYEKLMIAGHDEISGTLIGVRQGNCYLMIGEYDKALTYFNDSLSFKEDPQVYYQIGLTYVQKEEFDKATEPLLQAKELDPSISGIYFLLAEIYEQENDYEKALKEIEDSLAYNEINIDLYLKAADLATKLNDFKKADKYYKEAIEMDKDNDRIILKYADFLNFIDDYDGVISLLEGAPDVVRELPGSLWLLANAYNSIDEYETAGKLFNQASLFLMEELDFLKDYAFFLREDGQRDKMTEVAKRFVALSDQPDEEMMALLDETNYF